MSEAAAAPAPAAPVAAPAPKGSKLLPIVLIVNVLLVAAVLAVVLLRPMGGGAHATPAASEKGEKESSEHGEGDEKKEDGAHPKHGPTVALGDFVIHLRNPEADRYARMSFSVEVSAEPDKEKVTAALPVIRDTFIGLLSDRTLEELRGSAGLTKTKEELLKALDGAAPGMNVKAVYITDFVVQ